MTQAVFPLPDVPQGRSGSMMGKSSLFGGRGVPQPGFVNPELSFRYHNSIYNIMYIDHILLCTLYYYIMHTHHLHGMSHIYS